jgi:hypothetical protein
VYASAAGAALVNVIHDLGEIDRLTVDERNAQSACAGGVSFLTRCVADGADMVAHPAEAAGVYVLFGFFRHHHFALPP